MVMGRVTNDMLFAALAPLSFVGTRPTPAADILTLTTAAPAAVAAPWGKGVVQRSGCGGGGGGVGGGRLGGRGFPPPPPTNCAPVAGQPTTEPPRGRAAVAHAPATRAVLEVVARGIGQLEEEGGKGKGGGGKGGDRRQNSS